MSLGADTGTGGGIVPVFVVLARMPMHAFFGVGGIRLTAAGAPPAVPRHGVKPVPVHATIALVVNMVPRIAVAITATLVVTTPTLARVAVPGVGTVLLAVITHTKVLIEPVAILAAREDTRAEAGLAVVVVQLVLGTLTLLVGDVGTQCLGTMSRRHVVVPSLDVLEARTRTDIGKGPA